MPCDGKNKACQQRRELLHQLKCLITTMERKKPCEWDEEPCGAKPPPRCRTASYKSTGCPSGGCEPVLFCKPECPPKCPESVPVCQPPCKPICQPPCKMMVCTPPVSSRSRGGGSSKCPKCPPPCPQPRCVVCPPACKTCPPPCPPPCPKPKCPSCPPPCPKPKCVSCPPPCPKPKCVSCPPPCPPKCIMCPPPCPTLMCFTCLPVCPPACPPPCPPPCPPTCVICPAPKCGSSCPPPCPPPYKPSCPKPKCPSSRLCFDVCSPAPKVVCCNPVKKCKSFELRSSNMNKCLCIKRNGLQDRCAMLDCMGYPECMTKLFPICDPGQCALLKLCYMGGS